MDEPTTLFGATLMGAVMMGLSCGTGCSPAISTFLSTYVLHAEGDTRKSFGAFAGFFSGKAASVIGVCLAASLTGTAIVESGGYFGCYDLAFLMPVFLILSGLYLIRRCVQELRGEKCDHCGGCGHKKAKLHGSSPLIGGFIYGLTPCAPLVMMAGYSVSLSAFRALVLGTVFSMACTVSPLLLMLFFMRLIAYKMLQEVPKLFQIIRLLMSIAVACIGVVSLINVYL